LASIAKSQNYSSGPFQEIQQLLILRSIIAVIVTDLVLAASACAWIGHATAALGSTESAVLGTAAMVFGARWGLAALRY